jgi:Glu-tRNA(Gln) amidotransferase subunit E-like FAD-binding protein
MAEENNYQELGFKCGLEIHQQLDTKKLFCNCPSLLRKDEPDFEIKRKLHAVAGESGEVDVAAKHEAGLGKEFIYQGYDTTCLVELDEEPPHQINEESLKIALQISILLHAKIIPVTQIMRKTVIDGSNTSGFQRTVLIAKEGYVDTEQGRVRIENICLEEDAARIVERSKEKVIYKLDRLGIPLVEITTSPDIKNPEQAKEVALKIGNILRSCKVKRGIGTIRQDVNLSVSGHPRVELKGVQDMRLFVKTIQNEIERQKENIEDKKLFSEVRNALPDASTEFLRPVPGAARMYPETDLPLLKISREVINNAKKNIPKLKGDLEEELKGKGLNKEMIKSLFKQNKLDDFKEFLEIVDNPQLIGKIILLFPKEIASHEKIAFSKINKILNKDILIFVLEALENKKISEAQVKNVLVRIVRGEKLEDSILFEKEDTSFIEEKIMKIIKNKPGLSEKAYMGLVMKEFKGKVNGREAMEIIKKFLK